MAGDEIDGEWAELRRALAHDPTEENIDRLRASLIRLDNQQYDYGRRIEQLERRVRDLQSVGLAAGGFIAILVLERMFGERLVREWFQVALVVGAAALALRMIYLGIRKLFARRN